MSNDATGNAPAKTPWHVWVVGVVALLWNGSGAVTIFLSQAGRMPGLSAEEAAYYAAQPVWFVVITDIALLGAVAAAIALLLRSSAAVSLFALSLAAIVFTDLYDLAIGTSRMLESTGALVVTLLILVLAVLELMYARAMQLRGALR